MGQQARWPTPTEWRAQALGNETIRWSEKTVSLGSSPSATPGIEGTAGSKEAARRRGMTCMPVWVDPAELLGEMGERG